MSVLTFLASPQMCWGHSAERAGPGSDPWAEAPRGGVGPWSEYAGVSGLFQLQATVKVIRTPERARLDSWSCQRPGGYSQGGA